MAYRAFGPAIPLPVAALGEGETAPAELVTGADLREHCRLDEEGEDDDLDGKLDAAVAAIETATGRVIRARRFKIDAPCFPLCGDCMLIPKPPLISLESIKYYDEDGAQQTLRDLTASPQVEGDVIVRITEDMTEVHLAPDASWPSTQRRINAVEVIFEAGYEELPADLKQAILQLAAHMYENREVVIDGQIAKFPFGVQSVIDLYKVGEYL